MLNFAGVLVYLQVNVPLFLDIKQKFIFAKKKNGSDICRIHLECMENLVFTFRLEAKLES